jgi:MarR-like DNA-binding transcriptional regulator SgrR of sgrS sRNA
MRVVQKVKQYQRIILKFGYEPVYTTATEIAEIVLCSDRHVRNVLDQMSKAKWIIWRSQPGRGRKAFLQCVIPYALLSDELLQNLLLKGDYQSALQLAEGDPSRLKHIISPFWGGKVKSDLPTLYIPFYRNLSDLEPSVTSGRAERHLISSIYSGLVRYADKKLIPDIAYRWCYSDGGKIWDFYLRNDLHWHNGQPITSEQILSSLLIMKNREGVRDLLPHLVTCSLVNPFQIRITLSQPDFQFYKRMANSLLRLTHPTKKHIGCGPFRCAIKKENFVRLEKHSHYHLNHPLIYAIEMRSYSDARPANYNPASISIGGKKSHNDLHSTTTEISQGFAYASVVNHHGLNKIHAEWLYAICQKYISERYYADSCVIPTGTVWPGVSAPHYDIINTPPDLPKKINIFQYDTLELTSLATHLKQLLKRYDCVVELTKYNERTASEVSWPKADFILGDFVMGYDRVTSLEEWYLSAPQWKLILGERAWHKGKEFIMKKNTTVLNNSQIWMRWARLFVNRRMITPLLKYNYKISSLSTVQGVEINPDGWFNFSKVWILPDN